jgi:hypothetical protein
MLHTFPEILRNRVAELDGYLEIEHVMRIAKARARMRSRPN